MQSLFLTFPQQKTIDKVKEADVLEDLSRDLYLVFLEAAGGALSPSINSHEILKKRIDESTNLREPEKLFPIARLSRRKIIYNAGPTNSGKTYSALQDLKDAE